MRGGRSFEGRGGLIVIKMGAGGGEGGEGTGGAGQFVRGNCKSFLYTIVCDRNIYFYQRWGEEKTEKEPLATFPAQGRDTINWKHKPVADTAILRTAPTNSFDTM